MGYMGFVEELKRSLMEILDVEPEYVRLEPQGKKWKGERLVLEFVSRDGTSQNMGLHIEELYQVFRQGKKSMPEILTEILQAVEDGRAIAWKEKLQQLESLETAREALYVRVFDLKEHEGELQGYVYTEENGLALVLYCKIAGNGDGIMGTKVAEQFLRYWSVTKEEIVGETLERMGKKTPPLVFSIEEAVFHGILKGMVFIGEDAKVRLSKDVLGNMISSMEKVNGAVVMFCPGVREAVAEQLGDYYLVFTSIHECMVHSAEAVEAGDLRLILQEVTAVATEEKEVLTKDIFYYDSREKKMTRIEG